MEWVIWSLGFTGLIALLSLTCLIMDRFDCGPVSKKEKEWNRSLSSLRSGR